jgi:hypothetical protein
LQFILELVRDVEDDIGMPFHPADVPPPDPTAGNRFTDFKVDTTGAHAALQALKAEVEADINNDGPHIDAATYDVLKARFRALPADDVARLEQITSQAKTAGVPISLTEHATVRRYEIARALVQWCEAGFDEDVIRDLLGTVLDSDIPRHPATPLGAAVGALTIDEAQQLGDMARAVLDGAELHYPDGRWAVKG